MLPRVAIQRTQTVIGKDTVPAMHSGLFWGYLGLIESIVARIKEEYGQPMTVIATGGLATSFYKQTPAIDYLDPDLTIRGLAADPCPQRRPSMPVDVSPATNSFFLPLGGVGRDRHEFQRLWLRTARTTGNGSSSIAASCSAAKAPRPASM